MKEKGAVVASIVVGVFAVIWAVIAWTHLGDPVQFAADGKTVVLDEWSRALAVFTAVLPLLTSIVGFWLGSQGKAKAQDDAQKAQETAQQAQANETALARAVTPDIVQSAIQNYGYVVRPEAQ
jgi:hypothetical protein